MALFCTVHIVLHFVVHTGIVCTNNKLYLTVLYCCLLYFNVLYCTLEYFIVLSCITMYILQCSYGTNKEISPESATVFPTAGHGFMTGCYTVLYCTEYSTVQYCTVLSTVHCTEYIQYITLKYCTIQYNVIKDC